MGRRIGGENEYQGKEYSLLPEDDYIIEVIEVDGETKANPFEKTEEYPDGKPRFQHIVKSKVISFANGDTLFDVDGVDVTDERRFTDYIDPERTGFRSGSPSKPRQFFAALTGTPVRDPIDVPDESEWVGKRMVASMQHTDKGRQRITAYKPMRRRPARQAEAPTEMPGETVAKAPAAAARGKDLVDVARETFGEDVAEF